MTAESVKPARMDPLERREQILGCAMRLFEQQPYAAVSTSEIAAAAGVARPLLHHYFGTKRELYLQAIRRLTYLPPMALHDLPRVTVEESVEAVGDYWMKVVTHHRRMWLATINIQGGEEDLLAIVRGADEAVADRLTSAFGFDVRSDQHPVMRAAFMSYVAYSKEISRQWLVAGSLDEIQVRTLLSSTLLAIVRELAAF